MTSISRLALAGVLVVLFGMGRASAADEPFGKLGVDQVAGKLGKPGVFVYDNNSQETYAAGHVPTARWLDYDSVKASDLPKDKGATLIFYCENEH